MYGQTDTCYNPAGDLGAPPGFTLTGALEV